MPNNRRTGTNEKEKILLEYDLVFIDWIVNTCLKMFIISGLQIKLN